MEDFKQYLSDDADEREQAAAEQVRQGLAGLRLESKVAQVAAERKAWLRRRLLGRIVLITLLILVIGGALLYFLNQTSPTPLSPQNPPEQPQLQQPQQNSAPETPAKAPEEIKKSEPLATNRPTEAPAYPAPNIRGENSENKAWKVLLDQIWYTDYPVAGLVLADTFSKADKLLKARDFTGAYVQLQRLERNLPANDTLRFLKGYCLLEMGEGADALAYFEKLEVGHPGWAMRLDWYRGLSLLLSGDKARAIAAFKRIAATPRHAYQEQSKRAIRLLQ